MATVIFCDKYPVISKDGILDQVKSNAGAWIPSSNTKQIESAKNMRARINVHYGTKSRLYVVYCDSVKNGYYVNYFETIS